MCDRLTFMNAKLGTLRVFVLRYWRTKTEELLALKICCIILKTLAFHLLIIERLCIFLHLLHRYISVWATTGLVHHWKVSVALLDEGRLEEEEYIGRSWLNNPKSNGSIALQIMMVHNVYNLCANIEQFQEVADFRGWFVQFSAGIN